MGPMIDFREYKDVIRSAVKAADEKDGNWKWRVESVTKSAIKIGWGYLSYVGESGCFVVSESAGNEGSDLEDIFIVGKAPDDAFTVFVDVADDRWADARTVEEGIAAVIGKVAGAASRVY